MDGTTLPPSVKEYAFSTVSPIARKVDWRGSSLHHTQLVHHPYIMASNTALGILSAIQALCNDKGCTIDVHPIGVGKAKDIQMAYGR